MVKHKVLAGASKRQPKQKDKPPQTADDYLQCGVAFEESAEKWRAGDPAKSMRFYQRALSVYDEALTLFPSSSDIVYNKARIQYTISQCPSLLRESPTSYLDLLHHALETHREALHLDPNNPDVLFNTAQVLSSIAEATETGPADPNQTPSSLQQLSEAASLFEKCLSRQVSLYNESRQASMALRDGGVALGESATASPEPSSPSADLEEETWASVQEPVSLSTLLETSEALMDTLSSCCSVLNGSSVGELRQIREFYSRNAEAILVLLFEEANGLDRAPLILSRAKLEAAIADGDFRCLQIDYPTYDQTLARLFSNTESELGNPDKCPEFLCCRAEAWINFANALADTPQSATLRWNRLTKALEDLTQASTCHDAHGLSSIHQTRGDVELMRFSLCENADLPSGLRSEKSLRTLVANAQKYYRGAALIAEKDPCRHADDLNAARAKEAIATCLIPDQSLARAEIQQQVVQRMVEESVLTEHTAQRLLSA